VVLNVTAVNATREGFVTVYPCGSSRPWASSLNVIPGRAIANSVTARIDNTGEVCVYSLHPSHIVVDVTGWFNGGFQPRSEPHRLVDTREGRPAVSPSNVLRVPVTGAGAPSGATGVVLNVTAVNATREGFVTVYPCGSTRPWASSLNVIPGRAIANSVTARIDNTGEVCVYSLHPSHIVVDVTGWFNGAGTRDGSATGFQPRSEPHRLIDTRER
jgi:uncharacterized membrane protein